MKIILILYRAIDFLSSAILGGHHSTVNCYMYSMEPNKLNKTEILLLF